MLALAGGDVQQNQLTVLCVLKLQSGSGKRLAGKQVQRAVAALNAQLAFQRGGITHPDIAIHKDDPFLPGVQRHRQRDALPFHQFDGVQGQGNQQD